MVKPFQKIYRAVKGSVAPVAEFTSLADKQHRPRTDQYQGSDGLAEKSVQQQSPAKWYDKVIEDDVDFVVSKSQCRSSLF